MTFRLIAIFLLCCACSAPAGAAEPDALAGLRLYLEKETTGLPGRVEVAIGSLDPRLNLAPCERVEPFVPPGMKLLGKATLGLRCLDAPAWVAYLPVEIRLWGHALVTNSGVSANQSLGEADVHTEEVELTREPGALTAAAQMNDKILTRGLAQGQVLRQDYFRTRPLLNAGDLVTLVYKGAGFTVSTEGRALSQAVAGQAVRVQTASGKTLSGTAQSGRLVEVQF